LVREINLYLARLTEGNQDQDLTKKAIDLLLINTNLEDIGDLIKRVLRQDAKRRATGVPFSAEGRQDLWGMATEVLGLLRQVVGALATGNGSMARQVVNDLPRIQRLEEQLKVRHLERLRHNIESQRTSPYHLDTLGDLATMASKASSIAERVVNGAAA
ncbi:MAG: Na/Pi cotransporter family protein, partial [Deinococcus sp.]|nr:Na/Pi cotransporter family protein [Deinococcus sp.]